MPQHYETKRSNRFIVKFPTEFQLPEWTVTKINRPKFNNDGWGNMEVTFIDPICPSATQGLYNIIAYIAKADVQNPLFEFTLQILDPVGNAVEEWSIGVNKVLNIDFGELDYNSDDLVRPQMLIEPSYCNLIY
jgi:hypothetical protein